MKKCYACKELKELSCFAINRGRKDGLNSQCRACQAILRKSHYERNKEKDIARVIARRKELRSMMWEYKSTKSCVDCGESRTVCLDFDHLEDKVASISRMVSDGLGWETILKEIEKCEVVCSNCHRIRTFERGGFYVGEEIDVVPSL